MAVTLHRSAGCLYLSFVLFSYVNAVHAEDTSGKGNEASQAALDLTVPESPAFAALDVTPQSVVRPDRGRDFAVGLLNGLDANGNFQTGLAIDTSPYWLVYGDKQTLKDYENDYKLVRGLKSFQLSLATAAGVEDSDEAIRLAGGLRLSLLDVGDPRLDEALITCIEEEFEKHNFTIDNRSNLPPESSNKIRENDEKIIPLKLRLEQLSTNSDEENEAEIVALQNQIDELLKGRIAIEKENEKRIRDSYLVPLTKSVKQNCQSDEAKKRNWNRSSISLGVAPTFISDSGDTEDFEWGGASFYGSIAYGFDGFQQVTADMQSGLTGSTGNFWRDHAQVIAHVRYRADEVVPVEGMKGSFEEQDKLTAGGRFRLVYDQFNINAEGAAIYVDREDRDSDTFYRLQLGLDYKIPGTENLYLAMSIGGDLGRADGNQTFVFSALKWAFQSSPSISAK